jgi:hypothetical protein
MLGIPMIDGDPVEAGAQIASGVSHEVAREGLYIRKFRRVFGCDNEPEMMSVVVTPLSEGFMISIVAVSAKHPGRIAILCYAVAAEIGKMRGKRRALRPMTNHAGFNHNAA